jgi:hypothetical protein
MKEELDEAERTNYVAIEKPVSRDVANALGPALDNRIISTSFREAAMKIARNDGEARVAVFQFLRGFGSDDAEFSGSKELQLALASDTHLRVIHIHMCLSLTMGKFGDTLASIAQGLTSNASIKKVFWSISEKDRKEASDNTLKALRELIEKNTTIEALYFKRGCGKSCSARTVDPAEDVFAKEILEGLKKNATIKKFRLDTYHVLSEKNEELLLGIVAKNRTMERAYVDFEKKDGDPRLELLLACNREKWMERTTDESVPREERLDVVMEAREFKSVSRRTRETSHVFPVPLFDVTIRKGKVRLYQACTHILNTG